MTENESIEPQIQIPIPNPPATPLRKEPSFSRWCGDERRHHQIDPAAAATGEEESDEFDLPLLRSESDKASLESDSPRCNEFRQRSMHLGSSPSLDYLVTIGKNYVPLDIVNGLHTSDSMERLDSLGSSSSSCSFSAAMVLKTLFFILVWYTFSTLLTLYNKTLLGDHLGKFPVPLMMNTVNFGMQAVLSNAIVFFQSKCCENNSRGPSMAWGDYFFRVVPTALGTALDINLSNASLVFISVTFATMISSFDTGFRLESASFKLLGIILVISVGVLLTVARETQFEFWGFIFVMLAAVMSGFRWCMTQILLQKEAMGAKSLYDESTSMDEDTKPWRASRAQEDRDQAYFSRIHSRNELGTSRKRPLTQEFKMKQFRAKIRLPGLCRSKVSQVLSTDQEDGRKLPPTFDRRLTAVATREFGSLDGNRAVESPPGTFDRLRERSTDASTTFDRRQAADFVRFSNRFQTLVKHCI